MVIVTQNLSDKEFFLIADFQNRVLTGHLGHLNGRGMGRGFIISFTPASPQRLSRTFYLLTLSTLPKPPLLY